MTLRAFPDGQGPINPAEAILAVIGMRVVITRVVEPITPAQWKRARDLQFEVNKAAHALVTGDLPPPDMDHDRPGYMLMLRDITRPYDAQQVKAMIDEIPPELADAAGPFTMLAAQAFQFLAGQLPRQAIKSISTGTQAVEPPARLMGKFDALFDILDEPVEALNRAATGQLLKAQVTALTQIFPSLTEYMQRAVAKEIVLARGEDPSFALERHTEMGVETLVGVDITGPALRQLLTTPPSQPSGNKPGPSSDAAVPQQFMTRTQRTDANAP